MLSSIVSNPIMQQMDRIVQSVNNKAQKDVQHIRQARKDTVVLSAKALFIAQENKKLEQPKHTQAADPTLTAASGRKERSFRELWGYRSEYESMQWRSFELRDAKQYVQEAKNYLELASRKDIDEEQRQRYLEAADIIKKFSVERIAETGNRILNYAECDSIRGERLKRKSIFEGVTKESLGLFDLEDKGLDKVMQAIDKVLPTIDKITEKIINTNKIEYNINLDKFRYEYHQDSQEDVGELLRNSILWETFTSKTNYEDVKANLEKAMHFNPDDDVEHLESNIITKYEILYKEAMENRRYAAEFYKTHKPPV